MKKVLVTSLLLLSFLSYANALKIDTTSFDTLWDDITKEVMADVNVMMQDFWTWQENFEWMMDDFQLNLENDLAKMTKRINSMMDWIMLDLDNQMLELEADLNKLWNELPTKITWNLDNRLSVFFDKLELWFDSEEYMSTLNKLTDKIEKLDSEWRFKSKLLQDAVEYIWTKTNIEKNEIVKNLTEWIKNQDIKKLSEDELETLKELFDWLSFDIN